MNDQRSYGMSLPLKRKERESLFAAKRPPPPPPPPRETVTVTASTTMRGSKGIEITSSNKLLAGYMAYEFLMKGTLLGQKFDAARSATAARGKSRPEADSRTPPVNGNESYKEITSLLMMKSDGGVSIPGIVNPTQLARWIEM